MNIYESKTKRINVRSFPHINLRLKELAKVMGISESAVVQLAINDLYNKEYDKI